MPTTLLDKDGNEVEVKTADEIKAEQEKAIEEAKASAKAEYDAQIRAKEEEVKKLQDKVGNFEKLRSKTELQEEEEKALKADLDKVRSELGEVKTSAEQMITNHFMQSEIDRIAGTDEKFKEQIKANLDMLNMPAKTNEEISTKIKKAAINAQIDMGRVPSFDSASVVPASAAGGQSVKGQMNTQDKEEALNLGKQFGLNEDDFKKYNKI